jgi:hypothetical protein
LTIGIHSETQAMAAKVPPAADEPSAPQRTLTPEAQRALAEAEARRKQAAEKADPQAPKEIGGQAGPDPARYGDWEKGGIVSDF